MARARNIKPGFFTNGDLADCSPLARLLFIGLWGICDREGRLIDKPRDIKAKTLPYDECDCDALLSELNKSGFIRRYSESLQPGGERVNLIWVPRFIKHQHIHVNEPHSELPEFKEDSSTIRTNPDLSGKVPPILNDECLKMNDDRGTVVQPKKEPRNATPRQRLETYLERNPGFGDECANYAASKHGFDQQRIAADFDKFCNHHLAKGSVMANWPAAWRTWCSNSVEFANKPGRTGSAGFTVRGNSASVLASVIRGRAGKSGGGDGVGGVPTAGQADPDGGGTPTGEGGVANAIPLTWPGTQ